ncbi:hypothetical protein [Chryseobacterium camelliae]|uniref:hypothetical protein n=1 Tax=Chryseobacterium camelliae TaxID=1265445 RepID=UPI0030029EE4
MRRGTVNRYGSSCPKKLLALSKEFSPEGTCTASKKYQDIRLAELDSESRTSAWNNLRGKENHHRKSVPVRRIGQCRLYGAGYGSQRRGTGSGSLSGP